MPTPLRHRPERWLFTGLLAVLLAPVLAQGLDRPLASFLGASPSGAATTIAALLVAVSGWLLTGWRAHETPVLPLAGSVVSALACGLVFDLHGPGFVALGVVALVTVGLARALPCRAPEALDGLIARHRVLTAVYTLFAVLSVVQVARVSVFMADPARTEAQVIPGATFLETHSCLTAYVRGYELARDRVDNLYLAERWPDTTHADPRPVTPFSPFDVDAYFYPPPFLLASSVLAPLGGDFLAQRAAWFGLTGVFLMAALLLLARELGGARWHRPLLLAPLFFGSLPVLASVQIGNAQAFVATLAVLAMLAFERDRPALGGLALALATAAKVSPGILGIILIVQRRWRAVAWTAAFGGLLVVASMLAFGTGPIESWLHYVLPRLSSGEAFTDILQQPDSAVLNLSPAGTPLRLAILGLELEDPWLLGRWINHGVTIGLVAITVVLARRQPGPGREPPTRRAVAWMALLFLVSLRSFFAPGYVAFSFFWAITFLATEVRSARGSVLLVLLFAIAMIWPPLSPEAMALYLFVPQVTLIAVAVWLVVRAPAGASARSGT